MAVPISICLDGQERPGTAIYYGFFHFVEKTLKFKHSAFCLFSFLGFYRASGEGKKERVERYLGKKNNILGKFQGGEEKKMLSKRLRRNFQS